MRILLVLDALCSGGAEIFTLRLGAALRRSGHEVGLCVLRADILDKALAQTINPTISKFFYLAPLICWVTRLDGLLFHFHIPFSILRFLQIRYVRRILHEFDPDVVQSNLLVADLVVAMAARKVPKPWVTTVHGDYLGYAKISRSAPARIQNTAKAFAIVDQNVSAVVYISDAQHEVLRRLLPGVDSRSGLFKILNGYDIDAARQLNTLTNHQNGAMRHSSFVVGMVARGIPEKGWEHLIIAFTSLALPDAALVLVGGGHYLSELSKKYASENLIFVGHVLNPSEYIREFDLMCLPSRYSSESLPTVVVEALALDVPVLATNVGEIAAMLNGESERPAGLTIALEPLQTLSVRLAEQILVLYKDRGLLVFLKNGCDSASAKFDMKYCVQSYVDIYSNSIRIFGLEHV